MNRGPGVEAMGILWQYSLASIHSVTLPAASGPWQPSLHFSGPGMLTGFELSLPVSPVFSRYPVHVSVGSLV